METETNIQEKRRAMFSTTVTDNTGKHQLLKTSIINETFVEAARKAVEEARDSDDATFLPSWAYLAPGESHALHPPPLARSQALPSADERSLAHSPAHTPDKSSGETSPSPSPCPTLEASKPYQMAGKPTSYNHLKRMGVSTLATMLRKNRSHDGESYTSLNEIKGASGVLQHLDRMIDQSQAHRSSSHASDVFRSSARLSSSILRHSTLSINVASFDKSDPPPPAFIRTGSITSTIYKYKSKPVAPTFAPSRASKETQEQVSKATKEKKTLSLQKWKPRTVTIDEVPRSHPSIALVANEYSNQVMAKIVKNVASMVRGVVDMMRQVSEASEQQRKATTQLRMLARRVKQQMAAKRKVNGMPVATDSYFTGDHMLANQASEMTRLASAPSPSVASSTLHASSSAVSSDCTSELPPAQTSIQEASQAIGPQALDKDVEKDETMPSNISLLQALAKLQDRLRTIEPGVERSKEKSGDDGESLGKASTFSRHLSKYIRDSTPKTSNPQPVATTSGNLKPRLSGVTDHSKSILSRGNLAHMRGSTSQRLKSLLDVLDDDGGEEPRKKNNPISLPGALPSYTSSELALPLDGALHMLAESQRTKGARTSESVEELRDSNKPSLTLTRYLSTKSAMVSSARDERATSSQSSKQPSRSTRVSPRASPSLAVDVQEESAGQRGSLPSLPGISFKATRQANSKSILSRENQSESTSQRLEALLDILKDDDKEMVLQDKEQANPCTLKSPFSQSRSS